MDNEALDIADTTSSQRHREAGPASGGADISSTTGNLGSATSALQQHPIRVSGNPGMFSSSTPYEVFLCAKTPQLTLSPVGLVVKMDGGTSLHLQLNKTARLVFNNLNETYRRPLAFCELETIARSATPIESIVFPFTGDLLTSLGYTTMTRGPSKRKCPMAIEPQTLWNSPGAFIIRLEHPHIITLTSLQHRNLVTGFGLIVIVGLASEYLDSVYNTVRAAPSESQVIDTLADWMLEGDFQAQITSNASSPYIKNRIDILTAIDIHSVASLFMAPLRRYGITFLRACFPPASIQSWLCTKKWAAPEQAPLDPTLFTPPHLPPLYEEIEPQIDFEAHSFPGLF